MECTLRGAYVRNWALEEQANAADQTVVFQTFLAISRAYLQAGNIDNDDRRRASMEVVLADRVSASRVLDRKDAGHIECC